MYVCGYERRGYGREVWNSGSSLATLVFKVEVEEKRRGPCTTAMSDRMVPLRSATSALPPNAMVDGDTRRGMEPWILAERLSFLVIHMLATLAHPAVTFRSLTGDQ